MKQFPIQPPIIVNETGAIDVFDSVEAAERYLEPIDVAKNRFVAFDSEGRLLRLTATSLRVTIEAAEDPPQHVEDARQLLIKLLGDVGVTEANVSEKSLADLVEIGLKYTTR